MRINVGNLACFNDAFRYYWQTIWRCRFSRFTCTSKVLVDGSVKGALSGKMYNRAVRYVKWLYKALSRILIEIVDEGIKETVKGIFLLENLKKEIDTLSYDLNENSLSTVVDSEIFRDYLNCFISTIDNIRHSGELAKFWLTFIDMATVLLNTMYGTRSGNWDLLIESLREMIPFTFVYDRIHYARYLTVMVAEMTNLEFTNPDIYVPESEFFSST